MTWSLKLESPQGTFCEIKSEPAIVSFPHSLCEKEKKEKKKGGPNNLPNISTTSSLAFMFTYNLALFETKRIDLYAKWSNHCVYLNWLCFFGNYYLVAMIEFKAHKKERFSSCRWSKEKVVQPVPSKIIEYIWRYCPKLFTFLKKKHIIPKLPYKHACHSTMRKVFPVPVCSSLPSRPISQLFQCHSHPACCLYLSALFWPGGTITHEEFENFKKLYLEDLGNVKGKLHAELER